MLKACDKVQPSALSPQPSALSSVRRDDGDRAAQLLLQLGSRGYGHIPRGIRRAAHHVEHRAAARRELDELRGDLLTRELVDRGLRLFGSGVDAEAEGCRGRSFTGHW